jgi:hypothetical protein
VKEHDVAYNLAISRGVAALPCKDLEVLANRSLECGCRPYLVADYDRSIRDVWESRHGED